eukprot:TRINITY_DN11376_c0_g1_i1.p1 TRINITY_DN11376_c0_g1~~TRINITY_DN11376_c0_g1_i1.p1  ORF type:complete len:142 (-),score=6.93 TRINITY_DN11376_c0_g1_i1:82-507(-)
MYHLATECQGLHNLQQENHRGEGRELLHRRGLSLVKRCSTISSAQVHHIVLSFWPAQAISRVQAMKGLEEKGWQLNHLGELAVVFSLSAIDFMAGITTACHWFILLNCLGLRLTRLPFPAFATPALEPLQACSILAPADRH